jgi:flagellar motor switch protein FliN/FliY
MPESIAILKSIVETADFAAALSNAISENVGRLVLVEDPTVSEEPLATLLSDSEPLLQTDWTFETAAGATQPLMMVVSGPDALGLLTVVTGAGEADPELTEGALAHLSPVMQGIAQGFGIALGNATEQPLTAQEFNFAAAPISIGEGFAASQAAVAILVAYHVQGGPDGALAIYMTPETAAAIGSAPASADEAASDAAFGEFAEGETPLLTAFGMPDQSAAFAAPMAGGPLAAIGQSANPFQSFEAFGGGGDGVSRSMDLIKDIPLDVSVELGRVQMLIKDVLELATGSIVELERVAGEPVDLLVNGQLIAKGEVVVIEDNFGIRITEIVSPADRLSGVGRRAA